MPKPPNPSPHTTTATPEPERTSPAQLPGPEWDDAIDSWSASLESLDSIPVLVSGEVSTPAPLPSAHPIAPRDAVIGSVLGSQPQSQGDDNDSGVVQIPNLEELSAAHARPRTPVPVSVGAAAQPHDPADPLSPPTEPEHTFPLAEFVVDAEEVLFTEDVALDDEVDPFAGPPPAGENVDLEPPVAATVQDVDAFVKATSWEETKPPEAGPTLTYREERLAFLVDELEARQAEVAPGAKLAWVAVEAARAAHAAGAVEFISRLIDRACDADPDAVAPRRERLRLSAAALQPAQNRADTLARLLSEVSERAGAERETYNHVLYTLRAAVGLLGHTEAPSATAGIHLLLARTAMLDNKPAAAAESLGHAGRLLQGELGANLSAAAARLLELRGLGDRGSGLRTQAQALSPENSTNVIATLRLAGGFSPGDALLFTQALLPRLSDPLLRGALGRWAADLADMQGDAVLGAELLDSVVDGEPLETLPLADRIALLPVHLQEVLDNPEGWVQGLDPAPAALFLSAASEMMMRLERFADALLLLEVALNMCPDATFTALLAERFAQAHPPTGMRLRALSLWAKADPARTGMALLDTTVQAAELGDIEHQQVAHNASVEALPHDGVSLHFAWAKLSTRQAPDGLALLDLAATQFEAMGESELAPAVREIAEDLRIAEVPTRAVVRAMARSSSAEETMDHPRVLALTTLEKSAEPGSIAAVYRSAAMSSRQVGLRVLEAIAWMKGAGQRKQAAQFLQSRWSGGMPTPTLLMLMRVLANTFDEPESALGLFEKLATTARNVEHETFWQFRRAEALAGLRRYNEAAQAYRDMGTTSLHLEANVAHNRMLWASESFAALDGILRDEADGFLGVGLAAKAAQVMLTRAQSRAESLADLPGAATLLAEAMALQPKSSEVPVTALVVAASLGQGPDVLAALEALGRMPDADAAYLRLLVAEGQHDILATGPWLMTALAPPRHERLTLLQRTLQPGASIEVWQHALRVLEARKDGDPRLPLALKLRLAELLARAKQFEPALAMLTEVVKAQTQCLPALRLAARVASAAGWRSQAVAPLQQAAAQCKVPEHQSRLFLEAAQSQATEGKDNASVLLHQALQSEPGNLEAFSRLRAHLEAQQDKAALAELLRVRLQATLSPEETEALRLERATLLEQLGDRAGAKVELRALLLVDAQNAAALNQLVEIEYEDGAFSIAAEMYLRLARLQSDQQQQVRIFKRLGRIYHKKLSDSKLAAGAYERALKLEPNDLDALVGLSEIYNKQNDLPRAIASTERALAGLTDDKRRLTFVLRLAGLYEKNGQPQVAGNLLRRAVELAPRSLQAIGELARHYERHKDVQARRVLLDTSLSRLHHDLRRFPGDLSALRAIVPVLRWCSRDAGSAGTAQLLAALTEDANEQREMKAWAVAPSRGRRLTPLVNPDVDEMAYPEQLPPGLRQVMRILGPALSRASKPDLLPYGVLRAERLGVGEGPRAIIDGLAVDLGVRGFEVFVSRDRPWALVVEPGDPPAIVLGTALVDRGPIAVRFAAGYALRLVATHFDLLAAPDPGGAALLVALVQQFVRLSEPLESFVDDDKVASALPRLNRVLGRGLRAELRPFVAEMASPKSLSNVAGAVAETAARVGLLACGDLAVALEVLLASQGLQLTGATLASLPVASALFDFSLSADFELLVRSLDSIS